MGKWSYMCPKYKSTGCFKRNSDKQKENSKKSKNTLTHQVP